MQNLATLLSLPVLIGWLLLPISLLLLGAFSGWTENPRKLDHCWRLAGGLLLGSMAVTLGIGLLLLLDGPVFRTGLPELGRYLGLYPDGLAVWMALLVAFIGWTILRYAESYLRRDAARERFLPWFLTTLASVLLLVFTDNLLVLAGAWIGVSLALHHLLVLYRDRPEARLAAFQKFIVSRIGDVCIIGAVWMLYLHYGTFHLPEMREAAGRDATGSTGLEWASVLFAVAAILKCAQVPFHGWLLRVMEAPTPVSALLHAGVINLGGFLWLRIYSVLDGFTAGHYLLLTVGGITAVVAVLAMMSQSSVKHALAWSTSAQMGFMLFEIGMGAYLLAFLHLMAHSLYKAHSFLASGRTVAASNVPTFGHAPIATRMRWAASVGVLATLLLWSFPGIVAGNPVLAGVLVLAVSGAVLGITEGKSYGVRLLLSGLALGLIPVYGLLHMLLGPIFPEGASPELPLSALLTGGLMLALLALMSLIIALPVPSRFSMALKLHISHGFYLMIPFDRLTYRIREFGSAFPRKVSEIEAKTALGEKQ
ncbi:NADH-quinone oxidoreductase subunit L [Marinobacter sp. F4206]|uniref:NADH-quinone oxidoreductase subunit L n=1 Tax=Marinobacter sp. F4206 TaxID=2861777 RepID=UPI001C5F84F4|nr:NADH-quinone oxidoreductase subunit L [Marinobacter sp. F4206]MBW4933094.1 NADH-quinone oxidoreductase subunit L [Marinobacter sp. F4206]